MKVELLEVPQEEIAKELKALKQALKQNVKLKKEQIYRDMLRVYGHLQHGGKIIDIYDAFKRAGVNADGDPRLAICRADGKTCYCLKKPDGAAIFSIQRFNSKWDHPRKTHGDVYLPEGTFKWQLESEYKWDIKRPFIQTVVPIIKASVLTLVKHKLSNYHLIWEVRKWEPVPPKDPILVKRLTPNLFGVIATWDLTPLERAIIKGRIQP